MVYVYILKSLKDGKYYIGITSNLRQRLTKHNSGKVVSTKSRIPIILVKFEKFNNYLEARVREKELKLYKGGYKFKELLEGAGRSSNGRT